MFDPIYFFLFSKVCLFIGIGHTSAHSHLRPLLFVIILVSCQTARRSSTADLFPGAVILDYIVGFSVHSSNFLLIARRVPPSSAKTTLQKSRWAFREIFAARHGTRRPLFSEENPNYIPSRGILFLARFLDFVWTFSIAWLWENNASERASVYTSVPTVTSRMQVLSSRELATRTYLGLIGCFVPYLGFRAGHSLCTCIALVFGAKPEDWPPLFGNLNEAYTIRRWYSHFWHVAMRRALVSHAVLLTHMTLSLYYVVGSYTWRVPNCKDFLRLLRSPLARWLTTMYTFFASAVMHIFTCPGYEMCMLLPHIQLYIGTAIAISVEDFVMHVYSWATGLKIRDSSDDSWNRVEDRTHFENSKKDNYQELTRVIEDSKLPATALETVGVRKRRLRSWRSESEYRQIDKIKGNAPEKSAATSKRPHLRWRVLGYAWVGVFQIWAVSNFVFSFYKC